MEFQSDNVHRIDRNGNLWFNSGEQQQQNGYMVEKEQYLKNEENKKDCCCLMPCTYQYISSQYVCGWV